MNDKGYTAPADIKEEQRMIEEIMKDPESAEYFEELDRIYAFKIAAVKARKALNLTQKDVADTSGLTQQMVSKIETGNCYCNFASILKYLSVVDPGKKLLTV